MRIGKKKITSPAAKGITFGLTSGIIATLGLIVGLDSLISSKAIVLGGVLTIAIADAFSDALGVHVSEEAEGDHSFREVWAATIYTFVSKLFFALTFVVPILIFDLATAIFISLVWGLSVLAIASYFISPERGIKSWKLIAEHISIAIVVIYISRFVGSFVATYFA